MVGPYPVIALPTPAPRPPIVWRRTNTQPGGFATDIRNPLYSLFEVTKYLVLLSIIAVALRDNPLAISWARKQDRVNLDLISYFLCFFVTNVQLHIGSILCIFLNNFIN